MFDLSSVKSLITPEGNVSKIISNNSTIWSAEKWDIDWKYDGNLPSSSFWEYPVGGGRLSTHTLYDGGIYCNTTNSASSSSFSQGLYTSIRPKDYLSRMSSQAVLETEVLAIDTYYGGWGIRITLGEGANGAAKGKALNVVLQQDYQPANGYFFHVYTGSTPISGQTTMPKTYPAKTAQWYKVRLELDTVNNNNRVLIDGIQIAKVDNANLSTVSSKYFQFGVQGKGMIRSFKYRNKSA